MKSLIVALLVVGFTNGAYANQSISSPNPRIVSQEDQTRAGEVSNKPDDIIVTKKIRRELMKDSALSTRAKNVNIFVANNGVTLKGTVKTKEEREKILEHAYVTAPKHKIYNQISVVK